MLSECHGTLQRPLLSVGRKKRKNNIQRKQYRRTPGAFVYADIQLDEKILAHNRGIVFGSGARVCHVPRDTQDVCASR